MARRMSKEEKQWMADEDVRTLERYQELMNDSARMGRARKAAEQRLADYKNRTASLQKIANIKPSKSKK